MHSETLLTQLALRTHLKVRKYLEIPACKLYITHLPTVEPKSYVQALSLRFSQWLTGSNKKWGNRIQEQEYFEEEVELSLKA